MKTSAWNKFINEIVPGKKRIRCLQMMLGRLVEGIAFVPCDRHGAFDKPSENTGSLCTKIGK